MPVNVLASRIKAEASERLRLLSKDSPLSQPMSSLFGLGFRNPVHPQLQCDFQLVISREQANNSYKVGGGLLSSQSWYRQRGVETPTGSQGLQNIITADWILSDSDLKSHELGWGYSGVPGIAQPEVVNNSSRLSLVVPSGWSSSPDSQDYMAVLYRMYESQISSETGLLKVPEKRDRWNITVRLVVDSANYSFVDGLPLESVVDLFQLVDVRFTTPRYQFNSTSQESMVVTTNLFYSDVRWRDFTTMKEGLANFDRVNLEPVLTISNSGRSYK